MTAEALKIHHIIGWITYNLTKSDVHTRIRSCLNILSTEHMIQYVRDTRSRITSVVAGDDFVRFMYYLESLILELFEKHTKYGPNVLVYIDNNLANNQPLKKKCHNLL